MQTQLENFARGRVSQHRIPRGWRRRYARAPPLLLLLVPSGSRLLPVHFLPSWLCPHPAQPQTGFLLFFILFFIFPINTPSPGAFLRPSAALPAPRAAGCRSRAVGAFLNPRHIRTLPCPPLPHLAVGQAWDMMLSVALSRRKSPPLPRHQLEAAVGGCLGGTPAGAGGFGLLVCNREGRDRSTWRLG